MTTLDGRGFQRALPRIERRSKWETANRIILDDGIVPLLLSRNPTSLCKELNSLITSNNPPPSR